jgi:6-phosphogluconolactonase
MAWAMANITITQGASTADIAQWIATSLNAALAQSEGEIAITLPGGSTPFPILAELAKLGLPFDRIVVWPGDDRIVPEDHPASNTGRIRAELEPLGAKIVALEEGATPPHFALAWLGMGNDGHIASLFPNTDPQPDVPAKVLRLTPDPLPPEAPFDRLSMTIPSLVNADALLFVARGEEKQVILEAGAKGEHDLPVARLLKAAQAPVTCFT